MKPTASARPGPTFCTLMVARSQPALAQIVITNAETGAYRGAHMDPPYSTSICNPLGLC